MAAGSVKSNGVAVTSPPPCRYLGDGASRRTPACEKEARVEHGQQCPVHQWGYGWQDGTLTRERHRHRQHHAAVDRAAGLRRGSDRADPRRGTGHDARPGPARDLATRQAPESLGHDRVPVAHGPRRDPGGGAPPHKIAPQPRIGTAQWWELRPAWLALLAVVLVALIAAVAWLERPMPRPSMGLGSVHLWTPALLLTGIAAASLAITELAISGFAPDGSLPLLILACFAGGLVLTLLSGRPESGASAGRPRPGATRAARSPQNCRFLRPGPAPVVGQFSN